MKLEILLGSTFALMLGIVLTFAFSSAFAHGDNASGHPETGDGSRSAAQPTARLIDVAAKRTVSREEGARNYFTDLPLLNQAGHAVRFFSDVLKDRVVVISFIYTTCKDACPLLTHKLTQVKEGLGDSFGSDIFFVSISVDPERDNPQALREFAARQNADHPGWIFLTGDKSNIDTIVKKLGQWNEQAEAHSTLLLAGNVKTGHWAKVQPMTPVGAMVQRLQGLAAEL